MNVSAFLGFLSYLKVLHWNTKSYAHHSVLDQAFGEFSDKIDEFVECFAGKYMLNEFEPVTISFNCKGIGKNDFMDFSAAYEQFRKTVDEYTEDASDLKSLLDDLDNISNKISYLLRMN